MSEHRYAYSQGNCAKASQIELDIADVSFDKRSSCRGRTVKLCRGVGKRQAKTVALSTPSPPQQAGSQGSELR